MTDRRKSVFITGWLLMFAGSFGCSGEADENLRSQLNSLKEGSDLTKGEEKTLSLSSSTTSVDIGIIHSANSDGKENTKLKDAITALESVFPGYISLNMHALASQKCNETIKSDCADIEESKFKSTEYIPSIGKPSTEGPGASDPAVLKYLFESKLSENMSADSSQVLISISDKINLGDKSADEIGEALAAKFAAPSFYAFDTSAFDADFCSYTSGVGNYEELSSLLGGKIYQYCQESWAEDFKSIGENVLKNLKVVVPVKFEEDPEKKFELIISVSFGEIKIEDYSFVKELQVVRIPYLKIKELGITETDTLTIEYK